MLVNDQSGQRFELTLRASQIGGGQVGKDKELTVVADSWKRMGVEPTLDLKPIGTTGDRGYEGVTPGVSDVGNMAPYATFFPRMNSRTLASEANRWTGNNRGRHSNAAFDQLYSRSLVTLDPGERQGLIADLWKMEAEDTASIHVFYDMAQQTIVMRKGVHGPGPVSSKQLVVAWNIHTWDMD